MVEANSMAEKGLNVLNQNADLTYDEAKDALGPIIGTLGMLV